MIPLLSHNCLVIEEFEPTGYNTLVLLLKHIMIQKVMHIINSDLMKRGSYARLLMLTLLKTPKNSPQCLVPASRD